MAEIIIPRRLETGDTLDDFLNSNESRNRIMLHMVPAVNDSKGGEFELIKALSNDPALIQEAFDWVADTLPSDDILHIINSIRLIHHQKYTESSRYAGGAANSTHYYLEADTPEGRITFQIKVDQKSKKEDGFWINYWGVGSLAPDFLFFDTVPAYSAWVVNAIAGALGERGFNLLWDAPLDKISFVKRGMKDHDVYIVEDSLKQNFTKERLAHSYVAAAEMIKQRPTRWVKVGWEMSGASLVTRIRQGQVESLNPKEVEVKAVKGENGKYSVWVRRSTGNAVVSDYSDLDGQAEIAWERFSEAMREAFIHEFKLSHALGSERVAQ